MYIKSAIIISNMNRGKTVLQRGFTIVELLIVIVVISILAAITVVTYNGIQDRANETIGKADAVNSRKLILNYKAIHGTYPTTAQVANGYTYTGGVGTTGTCTPAGSTDADGKLCLAASNGANTFYTSNPSAQTFFVGVGKGQYFYGVDQNGTYTKTTCVDMTATQTPMPGYTKSYRCNGSQWAYSQ